MTSWMTRAPPRACTDVSPAPHETNPKQRVIVEMSLNPRQRPNPGTLEGPLSTALVSSLMTHCVSQAGKGATMRQSLETNHAAIRSACARYGVKRLTAFGSVLTERFDQSRSDVDFLVEFREDVPDLFDAYFGLKEELQSVLGRPVDLIAPAALENPYFAASFGENAEELYAHLTPERCCGMPAEHLI
jgi:uncharacterized protein